MARKYRSGYGEIEEEAASANSEDAADPFSCSKPTVQNF